MKRQVYGRLSSTRSIVTSLKYTRSTTRSQVANGILRRRWPQRSPAVTRDTARRPPQRAATPAAAADPPAPAYSPRGPQQNTPPTYIFSSSTKTWFFSEGVPRLVEREREREWSRRLVVRHARRALDRLAARRPQSLFVFAMLCSGVGPRVSTDRRKCAMCSHVLWNDWARFQSHLEKGSHLEFKR